ncbi:MAG: 4-aminobutyrate aminotransferase/(S)-3-amino-2-methylpropionate transaminase [Hyphomicrobiaceae bacterium]|jgi:4-aminobutyrate aminotransferase/(S)-3-amino-2-methylpropionate transaminase
MSKSKNLIDRRHAVVARGVGQFAGASTAGTAAGGRITDVDGSQVIDLAGGIGVNNIGSCHPAVVKAIQQQAARLIHSCIHISTYEPYVALCEKLVEILPHGEATKVMLTNSGAESVENAIKIARQATGRSAVIAFSEAFHGRTMMCMTLTSKVSLKQHCGPFAPEVYRLPYPNRFRYGDGLDEASFVARELERLNQAFVSTVSASEVAAIIIEPVQGEGGFVAAPKSYLQGLRRICDTHGIMLICDEVQSGFARTGSWSAYEHAGITPDISTWAKSMGGGMPIGCVMGKAEFMDKALPGTLGGTYGGNPVACAAALATIEAMQQENLLERAQIVGERVRKAFLQLQQQCDLLADVRGVGAMIAAEFCFDGDPGKPAGGVVKEALATALAQGVLAISAGPTGSIIRVLSPLTISDADLDRAMQVLTDAILVAAAGAAQE